MWKCGDYIANKIVKKIVATGQEKRNQLSVQLHRDILKAKRAQVQGQIRKFLEFVNSLYSPPPRPHWWHSCSHFQTALGLQEVRVKFHPCSWSVWTVGLVVWKQPPLLIKQGRESMERRSCGPVRAEGWGLRLPGAAAATAAALFSTAKWPSCWEHSFQSALVRQRQWWAASLGSCCPTQASICENTNAACQLKGALQPGLDNFRFKELCVWDTCCILRKLSLKNWKLEKNSLQTLIDFQKLLGDTQ